MSPDIEAARESENLFSCLPPKPVTASITSADISLSLSGTTAAFGSGPQSESGLTSISSLHWYNQWLNRKFGSLPSDWTKSIPSILNVYWKVSALAKTRATIQEIANDLLRSELIVPELSQNGRHIAATVAFAVLGWQTMLYDPILPPIPSGDLIIADTLDGYPSQSLMKLKQDTSRTKYRTADFLLGFGLMLPKENQCTSEEPEDQRAFAATTVVTPSSINAAILQKLAGIKVQWINSIAPHLEYDKATNTLFLFRYPSFCTTQLALESQATDERSVLHSFAVPSDDHSSHWATESEVTGLLQEIVRSYRLLFGQNKPSRRLFCAKSVFGKDEIPDRMLCELCGVNSPALPSFCPDREVYRLARDFPILRQRITILQHQLSDIKPQGWKAMWRDKRDSGQWYTFWAVLVFGSLGVVLTLLQVVLQGLQLSGIR